ncbi:MAG: glutamate-1-semialdehyde 2,1-aminomutase [Neisseriaceae bacterium]|nr:glutamate-1-semialdehyde 2,1-aminomutase [Neisseriaceae bacterium]
MNRNETLFEDAKKFIPGGVNSPVRAFGSVGGVPRFIRCAKGACVWDEDDRSYIDYIGSWGPAIVGHAHPEVIKAVSKAAESGLSFGAPTAGEIEIAKEIIKLVPSVEQVRLVSSGTEATMSAIRLARGFTGRDLIIKFEGCYHGHSDSLLVKAGSGMLTFGTPNSGGVPADFTRNTLVLPYNDCNAISDVFREYGKQIACVIVEPFAGNMNLVRPSTEFMQTLRTITQKHDAILIFDEVMTGFRVALGGAQSLHDIKPDLTTMGKVIGGGMPLAAFGGRADIMAKISPLGDVYQAGTLSGNPIAVTAGLKTLELIQKDGFYENLTQQASKLTQGLQELANKYNIPLLADNVGGMFGIYFGLDKLPQNYQDMQKCDGKLFKKFFHAMLETGVMFAPSPFEAGFVSAAHDNEFINITLERAEKVFSNLQAA